MVPTSGTTLRPCPFCAGPAGSPAFPYATRFAGAEFGYRRCQDCGTRYIDPLPAAEVFDRMYASGDYLDQFYATEGQGDYAATAALLARHLPAGARVLDYGCGAGHLLAALRAKGFDASGAEFASASADLAAARTGCVVKSLTDPDWSRGERWDCVHFGDVIEHVPDPLALLRSARDWLVPGGHLSATGPLQANFSPVNAAAALFGRVKRSLRPGWVADFPPYHLFFTSGRAQRALFQRIGEPLEPIHWEVYETGWPYRRNGAVRNAIALAAIGLSRMPLIGRGAGNRFRAIYRLRSP